MVRMSIEQLAAKADAIVLGTVTAKDSHWNADHTAIHTDVTLAVEETVRGPAMTDVTFRVLGGIVGTTRMQVSTDPEFEIAERVVVFLELGTPPRIVGLSQGTLRLDGGTLRRSGERLTLEALRNIVGRGVGSPAPVGD